MQFDLLIKRLEGQTTILLSAKQLNNYLLASLSGHDSQGIVRQVSQKIQVVYGGLMGICEEIRASDPGPEQEPGSEPKQVDTDTLMQFLSPIERADLGQLQHSRSELSITGDLVGKFAQRLIDMGQQRQAAGDERGQL